MMYKRFNSIPPADEPRKTWNLALAYALSVGRQEDLAKVCGVEQSTVSRWLAGRGPTNGRLLGYQKKLVQFIERRHVRSA